MNEARFFIDKNDIANGEAVITGGDAKHICAVLRMRAGDRIVVCDGAGTDFLCELTSVERGEARASVISSHACAGEPRCRITLCQSLPKSDKFEYVVQKCVEAGVYEIIPVVSEYVQFPERAQGESGAKLLDRWRKISREAAKQSGRGIAPAVRGFAAFDDAAEACGRLAAASPETRLALIPYEYEAENTLKQALLSFKRGQAARGADISPPHTAVDTRMVSPSAECVNVFQPSVDGMNEPLTPPHTARGAENLPPPPYEFYVFIGPEGGFAPREIDCARRCGIMPVSLGPRILRTETAGFMALSMIMYEFEM